MVLKEGVGGRGGGGGGLVSSWISRSRGSCGIVLTFQGGRAGSVHVE